jgi:gliding motility-associated-like protein
MSKPEVKITAENSFVLAGRSIQLHASGAETYAWVDTGDIDNTSSADPMIAPLESKNYTVTGRDSAGCVGQAVIHITVEKNGFIPSLFTPNSDGKNDMLRVYGVGAASEFSFEIFNRNGSKVFSASSVGELTRGWDGTSRGVKQPGGVYFWKVNGKLLSGEKIQFNGKENGSIVLIR